MAPRNDMREGRGPRIHMKIDNAYNLELPKDFQSRALIRYHEWIRTSQASFLSIYSYMCALSFASLMSIGSVFCIFCVGGMAAGFSVGSVLSFGSIGSMMSVLSVGSFASIGCIGESFKNCLF